MTPRPRLWAAILTPLAFLAAAFPASAETPPNASVEAPRAVIEEPSVELGTVPQGNTATHTFVVRNEGTIPLEILRVTPTCGCTVTDFDRTVAPGASGEIQASIHSETLEPGEVRVGIEVATNDPEHPTLQLTLTATIEPYVVVYPGSARWTTVQGEPQGTITESVWAVDGADFKILKAESPDSDVEVEFHEARPEERREGVEGPQYQVELTLDSEARVGPVEGRVLLETDHPKQPRVLIPISGFVRPILAVTPPHPDFGKVQLEAPQSWPLLFKSFSTNPIKVTGVEDDVEGMTASVEPITEGRAYRIHLTLDPSMAKGPFTGHLTIHTDSDRQPTVVVPLKGTIE